MKISSRIVVLGISLVILTPVTLSKAHSLPSKPSTNFKAPATQATHSYWQAIKGKPAYPRFVFAMFTWHFSPTSRQRDRWNNEAFVLGYKGYFGGTMINSFDKRAFIGGIDRFVYGKHFKHNINTHIGYRFGLISGYDERMAKIAEHTPVLPFIQLYNTWSYKHVGIELSWILDVISISLYLK